jgi:hypothetical protein
MEIYLTVIASEQCTRQDVRNKLETNKLEYLHVMFNGRRLSGILMYFIITIIYQLF